MNTIKITWKDVEKYSWRLAWNVMDYCYYNKRSFRRIVAVSKGGLIPAALIAETLKIDLIDTICIKSYKGVIRDKPHLIKSVDGNGKQTLVVDEIVDSGATLNLVRDILPQAMFVSLFSKLENEPDLTVNRISADTWCQFPWENMN